MKVYKIKKQMSRNKIKILFSVFVVIGLLYFYFFLTTIRELKPLIVERGDSIMEVASKLEEKGFIKSESLFKLLFLVKNGKDKGVAFGEYYFDDKDYNVFDIVDKFSRGWADKSGEIVTIPEGYTNIQIASRLRDIIGLNATEFVDYAREYQGRLFPETYFFYRGMKKEEVVERMLEEFTDRVGAIKDDDVVLASIIEGEARDKEDMQMVAGILLQRLKIGMPLQVDAAKETYIKAGLPKLPINNPGLNSLYAVKNPTKSDYLYYITGRDGKMYYAKDYATHKKNIAKYLR